MSPAPLEPAGILDLLKRPVRYVPYGAQRAVLQPLLNFVFRDKLASGDLDFLDGRALHIVIKDLGLRWALDARAGRLQMVNRDAPFDTCISGNVLEFLLLASREEDPDSLFFQRRLLIEGDTALGLEVKNLMDSLEWERIPLPLRHALRAALALERYAARASETSTNHVGLGGPL